MYVIVTYDVAVERQDKVRKILRRYLNWVQNSVFEGEITESKLEECKFEIKNAIDRNHDSVYFYILPWKDLVRKEIIGEGGELDSTLI